MRLYFSSMLVFVLILSAGCGTREDARPVIGVSLLTTTNPFFNDLGEALHREADSLGYDVLLMAADLDVGRQRNQVSDFIVQKVAAIVLTPVDSRSISTAIREANEAGIPVFTADIATTAPDVSVVSHIATDNYQAGRMAAQAMIEALDGEGRVGIIDYPEVESVILRTRGFSDELAAHFDRTGKRVEIVSRLPGTGTRDRGFRAAEDMLQAHPRLDGIFAINDPSAVGTVAALEKSGRASSVVLVSVDGMPEGRRAVAEGKIYADAVQYPEEIGRRTARTVASYLRGESVPSEILIPTALYRLEDAQQDTRPSAP